MLSDALDSSGVLLPYPLTSLASPINNILISTLKNIYTYIYLLSACVYGEEYLRYQFFNGKLEIIWPFSRSFVCHRPDITINT